ncbi:hypothetical protein Y1Q_0007691 [Alligator mississippiensis]|uniref:C2H2-type domain-containing protein n=1 Tax=Alligator mississippiensis TaxID=8496 RepID=A0A151NV12_ALLMI|nr:hypothetical protein Y1Q_0007691 [Alligator mississippiensis]
MPFGIWSMAAQSGGAWLPSQAEQQPPGKGPANLEPPQTCPGSRGEMDALRPEEDRWPQSEGRAPEQTEVAAVDQVVALAGPESGEGPEAMKSPECKDEFVELSELESHKARLQWRESPRPNQGSGEGLGGKQELTAKSQGKAQFYHKYKKTFTCPSLLTLRTIRQTGKKPHVCVKCGKSFPCRSTLTAHRKVHCGAPTHRFTQRGKSLVCSPELVKQQPVQNEQLRYLCAPCGKTFSHFSSLAQHRRVHLERKTHRCTKCRKSFASQQDLSQHQDQNREILTSELMGSTVPLGKWLHNFEKARH